MTSTKFTPAVLERGSITTTTLVQFRLWHAYLAIHSLTWAVSFYGQRDVQPLPLLWPVLFGAAAITAAYTAVRVHWWSFIVCFVSFCTGCAGLAAVLPALAKAHVIEPGRVPIGLQGYIGWTLVIAFIWCTTDAP